MSFYEEVESKWKLEKPIYEALGSEVQIFLKNEILRREVFPEITYRTKDLLSIIKKIERKSIEKKYSYDDLKDKLGLRVICSFSNQLEMIDKIIHENFIVEKAEYKKDDLDFDKLDYTSNHYDLKINSSKILTENEEAFKNLVFELQVRSINQHAWSSSAHTLTYKKESEIPPNLKRKVYRLLSLYEIADDEFSNVNTALQQEENGMAYRYIRKLEGKIYRFAKVDFDRQTSLWKLKVLFKPFDQLKQVDLINQVSSFVDNNEKKLENLFNEYLTDFHRFPSLTQPEIFLVFYMLENNESTLESIYANELDNSELEKIKGIWA